MDAERTPRVSASGFCLCADDSERKRVAGDPRGGVRGGERGGERVGSGESRARAGGSGSSRGESSRGEVFSRGDALGERFLRKPMVGDPREPALSCATNAGLCHPSKTLALVGMDSAGAALCQGAVREKSRWLRDPITNRSQLAAGMQLRWQLATGAHSRHA